MTQQALELVLVYSVRYAMGRKSTAPSDVAEIVKKNWGKIRKETQAQIMREVKEAIRLADDKCSLLGDKCDHDTWVALVTWGDGWTK